MQGLQTLLCLLERHCALRLAVADGSGADTADVGGSLAGATADADGSAADAGDAGGSVAGAAEAEGLAGRGRRERNNGLTFADLGHGTGY